MSIQKGILHTIAIRKRALTILFCLSICIHPNTLFAAFPNCWEADIWTRFCPFAGVDIKYWHTQGRENWNNIIHKGAPGGVLYAGFQYNELFGLELGYEQSLREKHSHVIGPGDLFFGTSPLRAKFNTTIQYFKTYVDVNAYVPLDDPFEGCLDFIYSFGIGWSKPKLNVSLGSFGDPGGILTPDQIDGIQSTRGKWHSIFRIGGGLQYMLTDHIGVRSILRFESTSRMRITGNRNFFQRFDYHIQKPFTETYSLAMGIFVRF